MNRELEWSKLPIVKLTEKDREVAKLILSGLGWGEEHKNTRGFLYHNIANNSEDYILASAMEQFADLAKAYLASNWPNVSNWDAAIAGMTQDELDWEPHLDAYSTIVQAQQRINQVG